MRWHYIPEAKNWEDAQVKMMKLVQAMLLDLYNNAGPAASREVSEYTATIAIAYGGTRNTFFTVSYDVNTKEVSAYSQLSDSVKPLVKYDIESNLYLTPESFN